MHGVASLHMPVSSHGNMMQLQLLSPSEDIMTTCAGELSLPDYQRSMPRLLSANCSLSELQQTKQTASQRVLHVHGYHSSGRPAIKTAAAVDGILQEFSIATILGLARERERERDSTICPIGQRGL